MLKLKYKYRKDTHSISVSSDTGMYIGQLVPFESELCSKKFIHLNSCYENPDNMLQITEDVDAYCYLLEFFGVKVLLSKTDLDREKVDFDGHPYYYPKMKTRLDRFFDFTKYINFEDDNIKYCEINRYKFYTKFLGNKGLLVYDDNGVEFLIRLNRVSRFIKDLFGKNYFLELNNNLIPVGFDKSCVSIMGEKPEFKTGNLIMPYDVLVYLSKVLSSNMYLRQDKYPTFSLNTSESQFNFRIENTNHINITDIAIYYYNMNKYIAYKFKDFTNRIYSIGFGTFARLDDDGYFEEIYILSLDGSLSKLKAVNVLGKDVLNTSSSFEIYTTHPHLLSNYGIEVSNISGIDDIK